MDLEVESVTIGQMNNSWRSKKQPRKDTLLCKVVTFSLEYFELPQLARCPQLDLLEYTVEGTDIREAAFQGDIENAFVGGEQQPFRLVDADAVQVGDVAHA